MYAAANKKGGVGGVSQAVGKEFVAADEPVKLPEKKADAPPPSKAERRYGKKE